MPPKPPSLSVCGVLTCRSKIRYVTLVGGGELPLDMGMDPLGDMIPVVHLKVNCVRKRVPSDGERPGFTVHWETCVDPVWWYRRRQQADKSGVTRQAAPRGRGNARSETVTGRCAGCYRPDHVAYGRDCTGLLCDACAAILAAWRANPLNGPLRYPRWHP